MKTIIAIILCTYTFIALGQEENDCDTALAKEWFGGDTIKLSNGHQLYYDFNCELLSLLKQSPINHTDTIFSMSMGLPLRLAFLFEKEFKNSILFRAGCAGNGPCFHILMDKETGKEILQLPELIYTGENDPVDFVIYFDTTYNNIIVHNLTTESKDKLPIISDRFKEINPEYQFEDSQIQNNNLILNYSYQENEEWLNDSIIINIKEYTR